MSSLSNLNRNILRISGLNSGLDTESIVKSMLMTTQNKINTKFRAQTKLTWKQDLYKDINNELRKLKEDFSTVLKQDQNMLSAYNYRKYEIKYANENDVAFMTMHATPGAKDGTMTVDYVKQLATAARAVSSSTDGSGRITGKAGHGLNLTDTMAEVSEKLRKANGAGFEFSGAEGSRTMKFVMDGMEYNISESATFESVINSINANSKNLKVSYSQITDQFVVESKTTGANSTLKLENSDFLSTFGISTRTTAYSNGKKGFTPDTKLSTLGLTASRTETTPNTARPQYYIENPDYDADEALIDPSYSIDQYIQAGDADPASTKFYIIDPTSPVSDPNDSTAVLQEVAAEDVEPASFTEKIYTIKIAGWEKEFSESQSLQDVMDWINENPTGFRMGHFDTNEMGKGVSIASVHGDHVNLKGNAFFEALGMTQSTNPIIAGTNAVFSINGNELERDTNDFTIDGIEFTMKKTFNETGSLDGKNVTFTVSRDVQGSVDMVKKYVEQYNSLIERLNGLLTEKADKDYYALTEEEKAEMTEDQVKQWEEKAKVGLMRNDYQLQGLVSSLRMSFYNKVPGQTLMAADIGLGGSSSGLTSSQQMEVRQGKIFIDEDKLREALQKDPDQVFAMFTATDGSGDINKMGLVSRVNSLLDRYIKNNEYNTQYQNEVELSRSQYQYNEMVNNMYKEQERLWAKFTAMETALSKLDSQSNWISSMLGSA